MQPFLAIATLVAALGVVAVNSETAYVLAPVPHHNRVQRVLNQGWGWKPVRTITLQLPSIQRGWGWKQQRPSSGISVGLYGGLRIGPKQQQGWGWQPPKQQHGWGWQPQKQHGWGQKQQGWGWQPQKQHGWGWGGDDDDDDEDDYRSTAIAYDDLENDAESSEEYQDDESASVESDEEADDYSAEEEADLPQFDMRNAIAYNPIY